nr:immunoglobulin heavy chain junction region [Macaca mulatta]
CARVKRLTMDFDYW